MQRRIGIALAMILSLRGFAPAQSSNPAHLSEEKVVKLHPLPLNHVRLTGGPLKVAQEADAKYLLELQPDRMLAYLRQRAGLKPKAEGYGGWDGPGRNLTDAPCPDAARLNTEPNTAGAKSTPLGSG